MVRCVYSVVLSVVSIVSMAGPAQAQSDAERSPVKGMVWSPSGSFSAIRIELEEISRHGVTAVRLPLVFDSDLHEVADLHNLMLFQEIDARFLPAKRIVENIDSYVAQLDSA